MSRLRPWGVIGLLVLTGCGLQSPEQIPEGEPPSIQSILVEDSDVRVGSGIRLRANVQSGGGKLTYAWQANHGIVSRPYEPTLVWLAPSAVPYSPYPVTISLTVKDAFGREAKLSQQVRVYNQ